VLQTEAAPERDVRVALGPARAPCEDLCVDPNSQDTSCDDFSRALESGPPIMPVAAAASIAAAAG